MTSLRSHGRTMSVQGAEMYYEIHGQGEPLLLLHGGGGAGVNWRLIFDFDAPPAGYQLIVPDLRGHGRSTNPSGRITFREVAQDVKELLDHLGIERTCAIGLSMGAKTLLHVATREPQRVSRLILVSAAPYFPEPTRSLMRAAATAPRTDADWALMRRWHTQGDDQIRALWSMGSSLATDYTDHAFTPDRLGTIQSRTLIVHGDRDPLYPVDLAMELYRSIPNAHLWVIPNGGHGPIFGPMAAVFQATAIAFLGDSWSMQGMP